MIEGTFPFGQPLKPLVQQERGKRRVFVLGVYASAVHAQWMDPNGKVLIRALAVASEPVIFWDGSSAQHVVGSIDIPAQAGRLTAAQPSMNGPSGRSLDSHYLEPLGSSRADSWLCDLVPYSCQNHSQASAIRRAYEPRRVALGLPMVNLPAVPKMFGDVNRFREILGEIDEADPEILVLLGDHPIRVLSSALDPKRNRLSHFGVTDETYGRLHEVVLAGRRRKLLPLVHPRQASALGSHSALWRTLHSRWKQDQASHLLS